MVNMAEYTSDRIHELEERVDELTKRIELLEIVIKLHRLDWGE